MPDRLKASFCRRFHGGKSMKSKLDCNQDWCKCGEVTKNKSLSPCAKLYSLLSYTASHHFGVHTRSVLWEPSLGHLVTSIKWPQRERRLLPGSFIKWSVTEALCPIRAWHQHGNVNIENVCITSLILYTFVFLTIFFPHCWPQPTQRRKIIGTGWCC